MDNIFDLSNLSDVSEEIKKDIAVDALGDNIIKLFEMAKRPLSIDELTVGYFRLYKDIDKKTKKQIGLKVYNMSREDRPKVEATPKKKGVYQLISQTSDELSS